MIVTFHCKSTADVIMLSQHAEPILKIAGKALTTDLGTRGQFTPDQTAVAVEHIEYALGLEPPPPDFDLDNAEQAEMSKAYVGLKQRAFPLLDMLRHARDERHIVTWD